MSTNAIMACRPVEWPSTGLFADHDPTPIYTGSIIKPCVACGEDVYVGPRQQKANGRPHCFMCAIGPYLDKPQQVAVVDLGNPEGSTHE